MCGSVASRRRRGEQRVARVRSTATARLHGRQRRCGSATLTRRPSALSRWPMPDAQRPDGLCQPRRASRPGTAATGRCAPPPTPAGYGSAHRPRAAASGSGRRPPHTGCAGCAAPPWLPRMAWPASTPASRRSSPRCSTLRPLRGSRTRFMPPPGKVLRPRARFQRHPRHPRPRRAASAGHGADAHQQTQALVIAELGLDASGAGVGILRGRRGAPGGGQAMARVVAWARMFARGAARRGAAGCSSVDRWALPAHHRRARPGRRPAAGTGLVQPIQPCWCA